RTVFIDRRGETKDTQDSFRTKRQRDIETDPQRFPAIEFRPIEIHATLSFTLNDESVCGTFRPHIVLEARLGKAAVIGHVTKVRASGRQDFRGPESSSPSTRLHK